MTSISDKIIELKPAFEAALCRGEIGFSADGYLSPCFSNTYVFSPVAVIMTLWAISQTRSLNTNGHKSNSTGGRVNFLLACLYVVTVYKFGPDVFNVISQTVSLATVLPVFILSFLDLKGVNVPSRPIEIYYFLTALLTGYLVVQYSGLKQFGKPLTSSGWICMSSALAGSARNISSAFAAAEKEASKKPQK